MTYSFSNFEPLCYSIYGSNCCFLTCKQVSQEADKFVCYSHLFKNCPVSCNWQGQRLKHSQWNRMRFFFFFLEFLCLFNAPTDAGNLISGSSTFSKSSLCIWKFLVLVLFKPSLKDFEHYLASMWNECNCVVVWTLYWIALIWDWN